MNPEIHRKGLLWGFYFMRGEGGGAWDHANLKRLNFFKGEGSNPFNTSSPFNKTLIIYDVNFFAASSSITQALGL